MTSSSCSFRITRTAEDLAQTITALSQRLVKLEQRQEIIELELAKKTQETSHEEIEMLDGVDQLLRECHELLESSSKPDDSEQNWSDEVPEEDNLAA